MKRRLAIALLLAAAGARADGPSPLWDDVAHPDRPRCAQLVAEARRHLEAQARDPAIKLLREAAHRCPDRFDAHALLGVELAEAGAIGEARWALERARALAPADDRDAHLAFQLGFVRCIGGDLAGSLEEFRRAVELGLGPQERALLFYDLGDDLMALGRLAEAIDAYRRAIRLSPAEVMARFALAVALDRDEQVAESRGELRAALRVDPFMRKLYSGHYVFVPGGDAHYYVALAEQTRGHFAAARAELRLFLALVPDSPYAARAREHLAEAAGVDPRELNYPPGADGVRAAAALSPLIPELERCLPPQPAPVESTPVIAAPATLWVRLARVDGRDYTVTAGPSSPCLAQAIARARLPPQALGPQVAFPLALPSPPP